MKIKKIYFKKRKDTGERWKLLLPTIVLWHNNAGNYHLRTVKFVWWHYWFKVYIGYFKDSKQWDEKDV